MKYVKSKTMEFLEIDDENIVVYDPDSGDTHYIEGTGKIIISYLDEGIEKSDLVNKLCELYTADADEISGDIQEFLDELIEKKVVTGF